MKARFNSRSRANQPRLCASCGAPYQAGRNANRGWSLEGLLSASATNDLDVCPACRQRGVARRIGAFLSARM